MKFTTRICCFEKNISIRSQDIWYYESVIVYFENKHSLMWVFRNMVFSSIEIFIFYNRITNLFKADSASFLKVCIFFWRPKYFFHRAYKSINSHTLYAIFLELQNFFSPSFHWVRHPRMGDMPKGMSSKSSRRRRAKIRNDGDLHFHHFTISPLALEASK